MSSQFIEDAINARLAELRYQCGLQRQHLKNANGRRWSGAPRADPDHPSSWDLYWEGKQAQAQVSSQEDVRAADQALAEFISEQRPIMGPDWIGNDHGRLCWDSFLGGLPIAQHYCQLPEGHEGNHADASGGWRPTRDAEASSPS